MIEAFLPGTIDALDREEQETLKEQVGWWLRTQHWDANARLLVEYYELKERKSTLAIILANPARYPRDAYETQLLQKQLDAMQIYFDVMEERLELDGII